MIPYKNKILSILIASAFSSTVFAQTPVTPPVTAAVAPAPAIIPYKGETFEKIKNSGKISIGYRSGSVPISFVNENKKPMGYSIDICMAIIEKIKEKLVMPNLAVEMVEVTGATRIPLTVSGKVDMECGSTTNNPGRRKEVDFSVPYYMAGIRILTKTSSGIQSLNDLRGKKVAVVEKTSSIPLLEKISKERDMKISLVVEKDNTVALEAVRSGRADSFIIDDLLLFGERSKATDAKNYSVVGDFLSVEPLAIMIRKDDPTFKTFVDKEMTSIITSGAINTYYKKWFESPIPPKNENLNIPQSPLLKDVFRMPTSIVGN